MIICRHTFAALAGADTIVLAGGGVAAHSTQLARGWRGGAWPRGLARTAGSRGGHRGRRRHWGQPRLGRFAAAASQTLPSIISSQLQYCDSTDTHFAYTSMINRHRLTSPIHSLAMIMVLATSKTNKILYQKRLKKPFPIRSLRQHFWLWWVMQSMAI